LAAIGVVSVSAPFPSGSDGDGEDAKDIPNFRGLKQLVLAINYILNIFKYIRI
jgi:hypothetical protein